ncbi:MAG TPA: GNAT family N-acetyltransferase [Acidimicrobiales bacterium]|nr:GNAT family N-acetyltransferase [Acidimicrobiales bacterium]
MSDLADRGDEPGEAGPLAIQTDDPLADDVRALLAKHLAFSDATTPPAYAFALDAERLAEPGVTFFSARLDGMLVGVGALKRLDDRHAELKSMHTLEAERRRGVGRAIVEHILVFARAQGFERVSLETGTMEEFAPARSLYRQMGFEPCEPFGDYQKSPYNTWMTMELAERRAGRASP